MDKVATMKKAAGKTQTALPPVRIEKMVHGGAGLGFAGGPVFIPLTAPGDLVVPAAVRRAKGVLFAEPAEYLEYSPHRIQPPCPWFGECGGCQWMHLNYSHQMTQKETIVLETLARIGKLREPEISTIHSSPLELAYRHRARLHIKAGEAGFFRRRSNTIVTWDHCILLPESLNRAVSALRSIISGNSLFHGMRSCEMAASTGDGELTFLWNLGRNPDHGQDLHKAVDDLESSLEAAGLRIVGQAVRDFEGAELIRLGAALELEVAGARLRASPGAFFQVNPWINQVVVGRVIRLLRSRGVSRILDLFCGNGNFSVPAARQGITADGVDSDPAAVRDASAAACEGCRFHAMDVECFLNDKVKIWDAVLVDPPRTGLPTGVTGRLIKMKIGVLVYISCEPATLARDLARLWEGGYRIRNIELFDMFPQTSHVEIMVEMGR